LQQEKIEDKKNYLLHLNKKINAKPVKINNFWPKSKSQWKKKNFDRIKIKKTNSKINILHLLNHHQ
jgi:hypothetical protein